MTNVFFRPWVGENYKTTGFNGKRILVLGHSCRCGICPECGGNTLLPGGKEGEDYYETVECRKRIIGDVTTFLDDNKGTYKRFTDIFMGHKCTSDEINLFWNSCVFYNYIQTALEKARQDPVQWEWDTGKEAFLEIITEYDPDIIIAWGKELWEHMPIGFREDKSFLNKWGDGLRYYNNGKRDIPVYACYHPSTQYFNEEDTDYFKRLLEKV